MRLLAAAVLLVTACDSLSIVDEISARREAWDESKRVKEAVLATKAMVPPIEWLASQQQRLEMKRRGEKGNLVCNGRRVKSEVIYWREKPGDRVFESPVTPHHMNHDTKYLVFEYDHGGWNNIRMGIEIVLVTAHAMGRTLVVPPVRIKFCGN